MSRYQCVEFGQDGVDNRPLGREGEFLTGPDVTDSNIATFTTREAAQLAGQQAKNRREGCELWIYGAKGKVPA